MPSVSSVGLSIVFMNLAIGAVLLWRYLRTRALANLWLGMAIFVWPFVLSIGQRMFFRWAYPGVHYYLSSALRIDPISIFRMTQRLGAFIGISLLLVATIHLSK